MKTAKKEGRKEKAGDDRGPRFWLRSFLLAAAGFGMALFGFLAFAGVPDDYDQTTLSYIVIAFVLNMLLIVPAAHIMGIVNGVRHLDWESERRWLGGLGIALNGGLMVTEIWLVYEVASAFGRVP